MIDNYKDPWKKLAYNYMKYAGYPGKPNKLELEDFYQESKRIMEENNISKAKALVLGATPGLRDTLARLNVDVTCVDITIQMIQEMAKMCTHKKKETFVEANWLELPFKDNEFDLVLGDLVMTNIKINNTNKFLSEIKRVLKFNGAFIHRIFVVPVDWPKQTTEDILNIIKNLNEQRRKGELHAFLSNQTYNDETHEINNMGVKKYLQPFWNGKKYVHSDKKVEDAMNKLHKLWDPYDKVWSTGPKDYLYNIIEKYFKITKEIMDDRGHNFSNSYYMIVCKPN